MEFPAMTASTSTVPEPDTRPEEPAPRQRRFGGPRALQVAAAVAVVAAIVFGVLWLTTLLSSTRTLAEERDTVLVAARQSAISLNTLDWHDVDGGLDRWEQTSTGAVLDEFRANRAQYAQFVAQSKRTTTATVSDAAVSELDDRAGVARVLVGVDVTVTPDGQQPIPTRQRLQLEMTRTDDGWKVSKLAPVRAPGQSG
jgi:Mce-associated membrane protein